MKALLTTFDKYPDIDAGAVRVHMFGKILSESGFEVHVVSMGKSTGYREVLENDKIYHISFRGLSDSRVMKICYYFLFPFRLIYNLSHNSYDVIIHTQIDRISLLILQRYSKINNIPILYDAVEWFSESQFANGSKSRAYKNNNKYNIKLIKEPTRVIAISSYLEQHFLRRGLKVIRIPVIMDTNSINVKKELDDKRINIIYAGSPGKKDYLANVIEGISLLNETEKEKIRLTILGCDEIALLCSCGVSQELLNIVGDSVDAKGYVERETVIKEYCKADFSILVRADEQRYAKAGFPTKFVESLCCSTPVICNLSSDLGHYIQNWKNSILLDDIEPTTIKSVLQEITNKPRTEIDIMKYYARQTAEKEFDYSLYKNTLISFITSND